MATASAPTVRAHPPGPRGHWLMGSLADMRRDPLKLYSEAHRQYGDVVRFRSMAGFHWYSINHPEDIEYVLRKQYQNYPRSFLFKRLELLVGHGLLTTDGDFWRQRRRLVQPAFHRQRLHGMGTLMTDSTEELLAGWGAHVSSGQSFDVARDMMRLTLHVVGRAMFSADLRQHVDVVGEAMPPAIEYVNYMLSHAFTPTWWPSSRQRRFKAALRSLDAVVDHVINRRIASQEDAGDVLSMLLLARDEETGGSLRPEEVRAEIKTLMLAGHETTAVGLAWTWYLLGQHPEIERSLHAELDAVLGGRTPTLEDVARLPYTRMVFEESMRLYPPVWALNRQTVEADEIRGYTIPAKAILAFLPYVTHRHPAFWDDPERFDPERFTPERSAGRPAFAYYPFAAGPHVCIGNSFAMMEAQLILATIASRYRLVLDRSHPVVPEPLLTLRPRYGIFVRLEQRTPQREI